MEVREGLISEVSVNEIDQCFLIVTDRSKDNYDNMHEKDITNACIQVILSNTHTYTHKHTCTMKNSTTSTTQNKWASNDTDTQTQTLPRMYCRSVFSVLCLVSFFQVIVFFIDVLFFLLTGLWVGELVGGGFNFRFLFYIFVVRNIDIGYKQKNNKNIIQR